MTERQQRDKEERRREGGEGEDCRSRWRRPSSCGIILRDAVSRFFLPFSVSSFSILEIYLTSLDQVEVGIREKEGSEGVTQFR